MEDHKKVFSIQILIGVEVEVVNLHFEVDTKARMVDIINMKFNFMEVDKKNFRGKGSRGGCGRSHQGQQPNNDSNCYYCGKLGHMAKNCYKTEHDARNGKLQQGNYASTSNQND
jgi:hypothetical protein